MATIKDVASLAGVSTATVSRVINQTAWVEPVTRGRVEKAMRDLNYRRNAAAIALAKRSGDMLGLLTGNLADPFFARLARIMQGLSIKQGLDAFIDGFDIAMFPQGAEGVVADVPRLLNRGGMFSMMGTILLVFCAFSFAGALTLTGALTIIINRLLTIIHSVGQLIAATIGTTILVTGATSDGKLALLVPAELFKDAYRRMGLDTKNLSRTIEDAGTVIEPLLPWTSAGVYMATTLGVSTLDLLPWAIQCYAAIFFALIYGFSGVGIARTASASEKSPQSSVTE
ncbi:LacI family DNA-binding transcriptional regulator [Salmonella enterica]|nr:LacI family DNA-binding transcriptional regulator [Salmonella enterica]EFT8081958.1 LacI family DNA-binding transcriptional regulator [Salmonella enterica]EFT8114672.1 LacI family DNA-binding transcriptional regulator [Salmonella enterica]EKC6454512.1 LacI family DNA-binding transcriptional regulator [Salmonella enterica]